MKIIKPISITEDMVKGTAPPSDATPWEVEGRDFARDFGAGVITASDTKVYALNPNAAGFENSIKVQVVATGVTSYLSLNSVTIRPSSILVSPDDAYLAMVGSITPTGTTDIHIYSLATGNRVYLRSDVHYPGNYGLGIQYAYKWSDDSTRLAFWARTTSVDPLNDYEPRIFCVSTTGFAEVISDSTPSDYRTDMGDLTRTVFNSVGDVVFNDTGTEVYGFGLTVNTEIAGGIVNSMMKMNTTTGASSGLVTNKQPSIMVYNASRGEIVCAYLSGIIVYLASTLVEQVDKPSLTGVVRNSTSRLSRLTTPNQLYVRDLSKAVGYVTFSMVDYSSGALLDPTEELLICGETASHYVTAEEDGFGLFDNTTLAEITSNNPSVIATNVYTYLGRDYEALINNTDRPDVGSLLDPPSWLDLGVVNPLRMFDGKLDSLTTADSPLIIEMTPGSIVNGIAILNIDATTVQITMSDPADGLVYDSGEIELIDSGTITGWYEFFFGQRLQKFDVVKTDLPSYPNATITITALDADEITVGEIVIGKNQTLGVAQYGTSVGIIDFSRKEQDQFGNFVITPRRFSKRAEYGIKVNTGNNAGVQRTLADFRTTPIVWVGDENKLETVVYGYYRNFDILIAGPSLSDCTITVEGL